MTQNGESRTSRDPQAEAAPRVTALRTWLPPSGLRVAVVLLFVGIVLGGPSFYLAQSVGLNRYAMVTGLVLVYLGILGWMRTAWMQRRLCDRAFTLSIATVLLLRVVTLPLLGFVDLISGAVIAGAVGIKMPEIVTDGSISTQSIVHFVRTLAATLLQGVFLLMAFGVAVVAIYPVHRSRLLKKDVSGLCIRCGYDLRATTDRCPECGMPVPTGHEPDLFSGDHNPGRTTEAAAEAATDK